MPPTDDAPQTLTDLAGLLAGTPEGDPEGDASDKSDDNPADPVDGGPNDNPDEGTGGAEAETADGADDDAEENDEAVNTEPVYTVKIDGKDAQVTLKEALAGYQRNADYTRKTQEVAEQRKQVDAAVAAANQQRDQYGQVLKVILERLGPEDGELTADQWNALRQTDPARYATEWTDYQRRAQQREAVKAEQGRLEETKRTEATAHARTYLDGERQKLVAALPEFGDAVKAPVAMRAVRDYAAKTFGFTEQEMDRAYDHRMIVAISKAQRWDTHLAELSKAKGKIEGARQLPAPGARQPAKSAKAQNRDAAQKKFDKTGRIDDAVSLLIA